MNNKKIDRNPHQTVAFLKAISSLDSGGIILADEVGLGKTIEAALVIKYLLRQNKKNIMIATPASLCMQWREELLEKFGIEAEFLTNYDMKQKGRKPYIKTWLHNNSKIHVIIFSYNYAAKFINDSAFSDIKWDLLVIDEAHNMRNVFNGRKNAKRLYDATIGIPKLLLTATPLQNSLSDLFGLVSFIDPRIFEDEKVFNQKYNNEKQYDDLKENLKPILQRTLRADVAKQMHFTSRKCYTLDFKLSNREKELYSAVDYYVKHAEYGFPNANANLCILVIRKLLASSSFALVETFEKIKDRLEILLEDTKESSSAKALDDFMNFLDSDDQEDWNTDDDEDDLVVVKEKINRELDNVNKIIEIANSIESNSKMDKLIEGVSIALTKQRENNYPEKVVIFTESLRTQKYIYESLLNAGYDEDDLVLFNGNQSDPNSKRIYNRWLSLNFEKQASKYVLFKYAMVDYFQNNGKIFISTDSGAEGLNLQFANTIINYDLPWNPQKIEQRIGRCHRYGQQSDVLAMNFLNMENFADKRVYEILSKKFKLFEGVFGASDEALGLLSSDINFEKEIFNIYQNCNSRNEYLKQFDKLDRRIDGKRSTDTRTVKSILTVESSEEKHNNFKKAKIELKEFFEEINYWHPYVKQHYENMSNRVYQMNYNPFEKLALHSGNLFVGGLIDRNKYNNFLCSNLIYSDLNGGVFNIPENEIIEIIETINNEDLKLINPNAQEMAKINKAYNCAESAAAYEFEKKSQELLDYNNKKVDNWARNRKELLDIQMEEQRLRIKEKEEEAKSITNFEARIDFLKSVKQMQTNLAKLTETYNDSINKINSDAEKDKIAFAKQHQINPLLMVKMVIKF